MGWTLTTLIIPPLADRYGRKWFTRISIIIQVGTMFFLVASKSIGLSITVMFISGMATSGRQLVGYVYGSEFLTGKWKILYGTMLMLLDGASVPFSAIYFDFISKHSIYYESIGIVFGCLCIIGHFLFIPESPIWQLKTGRTSEGQNTLRYISRINGADCELEI